MSLVMEVEERKKVAVEVRSCDYLKSPQGPVPATINAKPKQQRAQQKAGVL